MGANLFISKSYYVGDKVRAYSPACQKPKRKVNNTMTRDKLKRKLINMESVEIDYTRCLNCGSKSKQNKWKLTHFCSLKCFSNYCKPWRKQLVTWANIEDNKTRIEFAKEEGLLT